MIQFVPCIQSIGHLALSSAMFSPGVVHSPTGNSWPIEQLHQTSSPHSTRSTNLPPVYIDLYVLDFVKKGTQIMDHHLCRALFTCTVSKLIVSWCVPKPIPFYSSILFRCLIMPYLKKICSSAEAHLGYLCPLATVNSFSMNILSTNSENQFI